MKPIVVGLQKMGSTSKSIDEKDVFLDVSKRSKKEREKNIRNEQEHDVWLEKHCVEGSW
jgi:hypothetical protein